MTGNKYRYSGKGKYRGLTRDAVNFLIDKRLIMEESQWEEERDQGDPEYPNKELDIVYALLTSRKGLKLYIKRRGKKAIAQMLNKSGLNKPEAFAFDQFTWSLKNHLKCFLKAVASDLVFNFKMPEWEAIQIAKKMQTKARNAYHHPLLKD